MCSGNNAAFVLIVKQKTISSQIQGESIMSVRHIHARRGEHIVVHRDQEPGCLVYIAGFIILCFLFGC